MREILLNGNMMVNQRITHIYLRYNLNLPKTYGHNLDALYDILSVCDISTRIILKNKTKMLEYLGNYGEGLLETFEDSALENEKIEFSIK